MNLWVPMVLRVTYDTSYSIGWYAPAPVAGTVFASSGMVHKEIPAHGLPPGNNGHCSRFLTANVLLREEWEAKAKTANCDP